MPRAALQRNLLPSLKLGLCQVGARQLPEAIEKIRPPAWSRTMRRIRGGGQRPNSCFAASLGGRLVKFATRSDHTGVAEKDRVLHVAPRTPRTLPPCPALRLALPGSLRLGRRSWRSEARDHAQYSCAVPSRTQYAAAAGLLTERAKLPSPFGGLIWRGGNKAPRSHASLMRPEFSRSFIRGDLRDCTEILPPF